MRITANIAMTLSRLFPLWTRMPVYRRLGYPTFPPTTTLPGGPGFLSFKAQRSVPAPKQLSRPGEGSPRENLGAADQPGGRGRSRVFRLASPAAAEARGDEAPVGGRRDRLREARPFRRARACLPAGRRPNNVAGPSPCACGAPGRLTASSASRLPWRRRRRLGRTGQAWATRGPSPRGRQAALSRPDGQRTRRPSSQDGAAGQRGPAGRRKGASAHAPRLPPAHSREEAPPPRGLTQSCLPWRPSFRRRVSRDLSRTPAQYWCFIERSSCFVSKKRKIRIKSAFR